MCVERWCSYVGVPPRIPPFGSKRTLVAIGTHDLDTLTPPFTYEARAPKDIRFIPLKQTTEFDGVSLFEHYESDVHLKPYLNIIRHSPVYPGMCADNALMSGVLP